MRRLMEQQVVLLTGATGALSRVYAHAFASHGASLVLNDMPSPDGSESPALESLASTLVAEGASVTTVAADVATD